MRGGVTSIKTDSEILEQSGILKVYDPGTASATTAFGDSFRSHTSFSASLSLISFGKFPKSEMLSKFKARKSRHISDSDGIQRDCEETDDLTEEFHSNLESLDSYISISSSSMTFPSSFSAIAASRFCFTSSRFLSITRAVDHGPGQFSALSSLEGA